MNQKKEPKSKTKYVVLLFIICAVSAAIILSGTMGILLSKTKSTSEFIPPDPASDVSTAPDQAAMKANIDYFQNTFKCFMFANTYTLDGNDIYRYFKESNASSIALANGLIVSNDNSLANRVLLVLPLDDSYQTLPLVKGLEYSSSTTMCQNVCPFDTEILMTRPTPATAPLPVIDIGDIATPTTARYMMNNFKNYRYTDSMRSIILTRATINDILVPIAGAPGTMTTSRYNMRVCHGMDASGNRYIYLASVNKQNGMVMGGGNPKKLGPKSMCPLNCDFN